MNTIFSDKEKKYTIYSCQRIENMLNSFLILRTVIRLGGEEFMQYDGIIRIQSSIDTGYKKETSNAMISAKVNYAEMQSKIDELRKVIMPFSNIRKCEMQAVLKNLSNKVQMFETVICRNLILSFSPANVASELRGILANYKYILQNAVSATSFKQFRYLHEKYLFLKISDEIGFPIYLEADSELRDRLIDSYRKNENQCNKKEMCEIILDYFNDEYIDYILNGIKNVHVFNTERVVLIEEGIEAYQFGFYGSSASLFAAQLSGMISDVYKELSTFHRFSNEEKKELLVTFNQNCKTDSEKGMLLQIIDIQSQGFMIWYRVVQYFLNIVYLTKKNNIAAQPNRNLICHGKQTNYNTREMNLKLIMCMDIIAELAWRIKNMKEKYSENSVSI